MARKHPHGYDHTTGEGQKRMMAESTGGTYVPPQEIGLDAPGDYGCDPLGDGIFRMVPSGDIVDYDERCRRLAHFDRR